MVGFTVTDPTSGDPMVIALSIIYHLARQAHVHALPVQAATHQTFANAISCGDLEHCRTISSIVSSCLATIFACTWVAIHPNIPGPDEGAVAVTARRAAVMFVALIAPELVVMWAIKNWTAARKLKTEYAGVACPCT